MNDPAAATAAADVLIKVASGLGKVIRDRPRARLAGRRIP